jgi:hypothetical protein
LFEFVAGRSLFFSLALLGYLLSIVLLFKKDINCDYLSRLINLVSYFVMCFALVTHISNLVLQKNPQIVFYFIILPLFNALIYIPVVSKSIVYPNKAWRFWCILSVLSGNKLLIIKLAKKFNLSINEGFGYVGTSASGDIRGHHIIIKDMAYLDVGGRHPYTGITITTKGVNLPPAILSINNLNRIGNHPAIPGKYYKQQKQLQFSLLRFILKLPRHLVNRLKLYTDTENVSLYNNLISKLPELEEVLTAKNILKINLTFPNIIIAEGPNVSFFTDYYMTANILGRAFSENDAVVVINTLIDLVTKYTQQK